MSRPVRRPVVSKAVKAITSLLFIVLIAASCSSDGFPESFADQPQTLEDGTEVSLVELNWFEGCTVELADSDLAADANNVCRCSFAEVSSPDSGISFEAFVELNDSLKSDPTRLAAELLTPVEQQMLEIVRGCIAGS